MSDENLFLEHKHPASRRLAVLEDDGTSAWLYMTEPDSRKPVADAWIYNRVAAPPADAIKSYRGGPPPAVQGYASEVALCEEPSSHEWSFVWSGWRIGRCRKGWSAGGMYYRWPKGWVQSRTG